HTPPRSPLFPYTTLFRSCAARFAASAGRAEKPVLHIECVVPRQSKNCESASHVANPRHGSTSYRSHGPPRGVARRRARSVRALRSEEHTSELQSRGHLVC